MASPIGHIAVGICVYQGMKDRMLGTRARQRAAQIVLLGACLVLSLLPDADSAFGIFFGDFGRYHNNLTHSLFSGLVVALIAGAFFPPLTGARYRDGVLFVFVCYALHVGMDYLTVGRGVMAFWPFTDTRFQSPLKLFYGLHWSHAWNSPSHLLTLANETAFALALVLGWRIMRRRTLRSESAG